MWASMIDEKDEVGKGKRKKIVEDSKTEKSKMAGKLIPDICVRKP